MQEHNPQESIQRKGDPDAVCVLAFLSGATQKGLPVPLATRGFLAAPLECDCIYVTVFGLIFAIYVKFTLHNQLCTNTPTCQICF
jgi:hypothetical protein